MRSSERAVDPLVEVYAWAGDGGADTELDRLDSLNDDAERSGLGVRGFEQRTLRFSPMTRRVRLSHYFDFVPILLANGIGVVVGLLCACL